ncbi:hypothetical protein ABBQ32_012324 [Trebouxia sp. C0010 RCD-2024]
MLSKGKPMDEKGAPSEVKGDLLAQPANNTPSKPRQNGHASGKKQPRAAKQLRFEGQGGSKALHDANGNTHPHTADAADQAGLASAAPSGVPNPPSNPPNLQASPNPPPPAMEAPPVHTRDVAVGSGSEGSQPKRRKRSTVTKNAQARANGGYGHYSAYAPQSGYGHHPIHGHYADYEVGPVHGKGKKQAAHRTPKQDDKGPCLNPACRTTETPQWRLGPMFCRELCNRCGTRWQRAKNTRNPQGFFIWVRNDLRSQGLEVPDAVARPAASPDLALAALREVENQPHAGRQHKVEEPEISDDDEDVEEEGDIGGRYAEEIMEGEDESDMSAPEMLTNHRGGHRRPQPRHLAPAYDAPPHHRGHRAAHRGVPEHYPQAAFHMVHPHDQEEEDSGASEADLLCSEVLSESHDEGSEAGSDELYGRRFYRTAQQYEDDDEGDSEMSGAQVDEEVAVTKRGRAVKLPAKYKAEEEKQGKRKAHDSPESRRHKRPSHGPPNALDWGHHPAGPAAYDSPQRMQRAYLPPRAAGASPQARAHGKSSKSAGSPHRVSKSHQNDRRAREAYASSGRGYAGHGKAHHNSYPRASAAGLDEADTDAVDALMGMTGLLYAH